MNKEAREHPITKRRKELNIKSRKELSDKLDNVVSPETIGRIERGERTPRASTLALLCSVLDCDPDYILGRIPFPKRITSDIAEVIPLGRESIELLTELKGECDNRKDIKAPEDSSKLTALAVDCVVSGMVATQENGGFNETLLALLYRLVDAMKVLAEYEAVSLVDDSYRFGNSQVSAEELLQLKRNPPERYRMADWEAKMCKDRIGELLSDSIYESLKLFTHYGVEL